MKKTFAVIGNPIAHSRSPDIHQHFARQFGHALQYRRILTTSAGFNKCVASLCRQGLAGANVTLPFKQQACRLATRLTDGASIAGAVNTLIPTANGGLLGANTDGQGLMHDIHRLGVSLEGKRILILGAGGATQGALPAIVSAQPAAVWLANRTRTKAEQLANLFPAVTALTDWQQLAEVDIVINATSASLFDYLPDCPERLLASAELVYDMAYAVGETVFVKHAKAHSKGLCVDGIGMLVGQAAESYRLWWQVDLPQLEPVIQSLRTALAR